jgi:hypothetical protein
MNMKKPELVIKPAPSGDPTLRGACSFCSDVTFVLVGDIAENRLLMRQMFDTHFREVHMHEKPAKL